MNGLTNDVISAKVKESIRDTIFNAIPEDVIDGIIKREVEEFNTKILPGIVKAELPAASKEYFRVWLNKFDNSTYRQYGNTAMNAEFQKLIAEVTPIAMQSAFASMAQVVFEQIKNSVPTYGNRY